MITGLKTDALRDVLRETDDIINAPKRLIQLTRLRARRVIKL